MTSESLIPSMFCFGIFAYMVVEDYKFQTIDIRSLILMFLFGTLAADSAEKFLLQAATSLMFFRFMYAATTRIYEPSDIRVTANVLPENRRGYLPALAVSLVIFFVSGAELPKIFVPMIETFDEFLIFPAAMILLIWFCFEIRLYRARKNNFVTVPGFGSGDIYVLALIGGLFGVENLMVIFFISLLVQLTEFFYGELRG